MSNLASSTSSGQTGAFSLVIPATTYCAGSDVEGEVLLEFSQVQDEMIDEVTVELRGKLKVYAFSSCSCRTRSDRLLSRPAPRYIRRSELLRPRAGSSYTSRRLSGNEDPHTPRRIPMSFDYRSASISPRARRSFHRCPGTNGAIMLRSPTTSRQLLYVRERSLRGIRRSASG